MRNRNYLYYLLLGILNWIGITYIYKYAIVGKIDLYILSIVTIILVVFGLWGLTISKKYYREKELGEK